MSKDWCGITRLFRNCQELAESFDNNKGGHYVVGHPATVGLQKKLEATYGMPTVVTTRGMTAILAVFHKLGPIALCSKHIYPGTLLQLEELESITDDYLSLEWFDPTNLTTLQSMLENCDPSEGIIFTETIGNSLRMPAADTFGILALARQYHCILVVDTTLTPQLMPAPDPNLVVVSSLTKYDQPGDKWMGGRISSTAEMIKKISSTRLFANVAMLPEVAKYYWPEVDETLERYAVHSSNAMLVAKACQQHDAVEHVWCPGLPSHPQHHLIESDYGGAAGGLLYIQLINGEQPATQLCDQLVDNHNNNWHIGPSFGDSDWRLFPFIGQRLASFAEASGVVRIAPGRIKPQKNISALRQALDSLG